MPVRTGLIRLMLGLLSLALLGLATLVAAPCIVWMIGAIETGEEVPLSLGFLSAGVGALVIVLRVVTRRAGTIETLLGVALTTGLLVYEATLLFEELAWISSG